MSVMLGVHVLPVVAFSLERKWTKTSVCTTGISSQINWEDYMAKNWKAAKITAGMNVMENNLTLPLTVKLQSREKIKAMFNSAHLIITRQCCFFFLGDFLNQCPPPAGMTQESWGTQDFWFAWLHDPEVQPAAYTLQSVKGWKCRQWSFGMLKMKALVNHISLFPAEGMATNQWNLIDLHVYWFIITVENNNTFIQLSI